MDDHGVSVHPYVNRQYTSEGMACFYAGICRFRNNSVHHAFLCIGFQVNRKTS